MVMLISPTEHLYVDTWQKLCAELGEPFVYRSTDEVPAFFDEVRGTGRDVILVSAYNDSGVYLQDEAHPNADLFKLATSVEWEMLAQRRESQYASVHIGPAATEKCCPSHRYSLKTDRFTWGTFPDVPNEVRHWYTTNLNIKHERISLIPFGLNNDGPGASYIPRYVGQEKTGLVYLNFQNNSLERIQIKRLFGTAKPPWLTFRMDANLPVETYLQEVASHKFVLAPPGNGLDCYRIWECLYLGSIPVLSPSIFAHHLRGLGLPLMICGDFSLLMRDDASKTLEGIWAEFASRTPERRGQQLEAATLSYWKERFDEFLR